MARKFLSFGDVGVLIEKTNAAGILTGIIETVS